MKVYRQWAFKNLWPTWPEPQRNPKQLEKKDLGAQIQQSCQTLTERFPPVVCRIGPPDWCMHSSEVSSEYDALLYKISSISCRVAGFGIPTSRCFNRPCKRTLAIGAPHGKSHFKILSSMKHFQTSRGCEPDLLPLC